MQVIGGDRRRGSAAHRAAESDDMSQSSCMKTISTTRLHSPNVSAT
jgi:hypothetical protein